MASQIIYPQYFSLASKQVVKCILRKYGIKPSKKLGQHFLINGEVLKDIIKTANISDSDEILEIGPGIGTLTIALAQKAKKVIAIEKDKKMINILKETLGKSTNVVIVAGDVLKFNFQNNESATAPKLKLPNEYKIVANLPYYIVAPVIRKFLELKLPPKEMVLMVQKEVAQRICAKPPKMNLLAVAVQFYAHPKIIRYVSKKSFWPEPKVDSAVIKIKPYFDKKIGRFNKDETDRFFKIVKAGFLHPRKQLINNLSSGLNIKRAKIAHILYGQNINPTRRAETLTIQEWKKLCRSF